MGNNVPELAGVIQGPFGSLVRDVYGVDNSSLDELFSDAGIEALKNVLLSYRRAGANIGGTPTFRVTDFRAGDGKNGQWNYTPRTTLALSPETAEKIDLATRIAREIYERANRIAGLIAPIGDTSGGDDAKWNSLGVQQFDWARQRQSPQIERLINNDNDLIWLEAGRYLQEAKAIAKLTAELGGKDVVLSFEAPHGRFPDPDYSELTFEQVRAEVIECVRDRIGVYIGINCTGSTAVRAALNRNDLPQIVYPNELDFGSIQSDGVDKTRFAALAEKKGRTSAEQQEYETLKRRLATTISKFRETWKSCLLAGAKVIGVCCGGTPKIVHEARQVFDETRKADSDIGLFQRQLDAHGFVSTVNHHGIVVRGDNESWFVPLQAEEIHLPESLRTITTLPEQLPAGSRVLSLEAVTYEHFLTAISA